MGTTVSTGIGYGIKLKPNKTYKDKNGNDIDELYEYIEDNYPLLELEHAGWNVHEEIIVIKTEAYGKYEALAEINMKELTSFSTEVKEQLNACITELQIKGKKKWFLWTSIG
jgi:hypothetical protein